MIRKKDLEACFPELKWIIDSSLREKVIATWQTALVRGGWDDFNQIPFTLLFENSGLLVDHTKRMTQLSWAAANIRSENLNKDFLVAGALLHDVGKLLEYELKEGKIKKSSLGEQMRHPESGAKLAEEYGLPEEVVHIIAAHSHEGDSMNRSPEAIIIHHCDFIDFDIKKRLIQK